jgi:hypothetical protein
MEVSLFAQLLFDFDGLSVNQQQENQGRASLEIAPHDDLCRYD